MVNDFYMKTDDLLPYYRVIFYDSVGRLDLSGCSVVMSMVNDDGAIKVNAAAVTITDATKGEAEYRWNVGDTDTAGDFYLEFVITSPASLPFTLPSSFRAKVVITDAY